MDLQVIRPAILSGIFAATAAVFGKLAMTRSINEEWWKTALLNDNSASVLPRYVLWAIQIFWFVLMIGSNAVMWSQFSLALAHSQVTLHVTVVNTIINFVVTALLGSILFGESITLQWATGVAFLVIGVVLLNEHKQPEKCSKKETQTKQKKSN